MGNKQVNTQKKGKNNKTKNSSSENDDDDNDYSFIRGIYPPCLMKYKFSDRRVRYYSEKLEISEEEKKMISDIKPEKVDFYEFPPNDEKITKIIIDTDLGTDWDDALALSYALHIPDIQILGITTNYGIPELRANVTKKIIDAYIKKNPDKEPIPIIAGASCPLGSHRELIIFGHEGKPFFGKKVLKNALNLENIKNREQEKAADFIASTVKKYPGEVKIISIGIPTNLGITLTKHKDIIPLIKEIIIMGCGDYYGKDQDEKERLMNSAKNGNSVNLFPNHNVSGDCLATKILFDSGVKVKIVSHLVTTKYIVKGELIDYFREKAKNIKDFENIDDFDDVVGLLMNEWFSIRGINCQYPHDPLTIHEARYGGDKSPIVYLRGKIFVHEWGAFSTFIPMENGPHYYGTKLKENEHFINDLKNAIMNNINI